MDSNLDNYGSSQVKTIYMKTTSYGKQTINNNDIKEVIRVLKSDFLTQGPISKSFSEKIKSISKAKHCTLFNSATSALHGACLALGLDNKSLLWTSANSFLSSASISKAGMLLNKLKHLLFSVKPQLSQSPDFKFFDGQPTCVKSRT